MKRIFHLLFCTLLSLPFFANNRFPDGSPISDWFSQYEIVDINTMGKQYKITDYGVVNDSTLLQTEAIQSIINQAHKNGGGIIVIPKGVFLSGALFFKPSTHLHLEENSVLKGSDDISDFPVVMTRIEGQTLKYFPALINADNVDGFTISGKGTLDGNGLRYWKSFWLRRSWNPKCTNMDEMRPRVLYVSNSNNVQVSGITLKNSPFWTSHYYKCDNLQLFGLTILAPASPVKAPSSDAVDLDVCNNVIIKNCYISVNDDAIALKGGKGPKADIDDNNGGNSNIIIEDCEFGFCHSVLTCGSESIHNRNVILRRSTLDKSKRLLQLKMRPDTPQKYEYITVEDITGNVGSFLFIKPWTQFFDLKGETTIPLSYADNITMRNIDVECGKFFDVSNSEQYKLSNFVFENLKISSSNYEVNTDFVENFILNNLEINGEKIVY